MWKLTCLSLTFLVAASQIGCGGPARSDMDKKLVIIGMDGLDPEILSRLMTAGALPHFKALADEGGFQKLATSNPPQSPVAWSDFISGHNPGHHDVFDFIGRNPSSYMPEIGMTETKKAEKKSLKDLFAGLAGPSVKTRRKGPTFWGVLSDNGIPSTILRCPVTFPAEPLDGRLLSGMGTPDLKGTQGIFSYFTTAYLRDGDIQGRVEKVAWQKGRIETVITGPKKREKDGTTEVKVPVTIERLGPDKIAVTIQDQTHELKVGEWSDWFRVKFPLGFMSSVSGVCRFHLNALDPDLALYASPMNIDPAKPAMKISHPDGYAAELAERIGPFYTQGMPFDTWALNEGRIDEETFLALAYEIQRENEAQLRVEMDRFEGGLLFAYFGITDLISHMFWRYIDPDHPNAGESENPAVREAIDRVYKHMDGVLGEIRRKVGHDTAIIVLSDHGFGSFRRAAHINRWLIENGYLALQDGETEGGELFRNVDWGTTRAYSVGFGGVYVNQFGREKFGVVYKGAETDDLLKEIAGKLATWKDAGKPIIERVYFGSDLYDGPYADRGPDLFVGFKEGYRASWQTALGAAPTGLIEDNMKAWGGDHLCDPTFVPGVLLSNLKLSTDAPTLRDIAPTVLRFFNISPAAALEGRSLL